MLVLALCNKVQNTTVIETSAATMEGCQSRSRHRSARDGGTCQRIYIHRDRLAGDVSQKNQKL